MVGPYIGIGLTGVVKQTIVSTAAGIDESTEEDIEFTDEDGFNPLDFGVGFGAGVGYNAFSLGVYYDLGLANLPTEDGFTISQNVLRVSVGYTINL